VFGYKRIEYFQNRFNGQIIPVKYRHGDDFYIINMIQQLMNDAGFNFNGFYPYMPAQDADTMYRVAIYVVRGNQCVISINIPKVFEITDSMLEEIKTYYEADKVILFQNERYAEI